MLQQPRVFALARLLWLGNGTGDFTEESGESGPEEPGAGVGVSSSTERVRPNKHPLPFVPPSQQPDEVSCYACSKDGDLILLVTRRKKIFSVHFAQNEYEQEDQKNRAFTFDRDEEDYDDADGESLMVPTVREVTWFENEDFAPACVALSPCADLALFCSMSGDLFVVPAAAIAPGYVSKERDTNYHLWSSSTLSHISGAKEILLRKSDQEKDDYSSSRPDRPTSALWWTTQEFKSVAFLGTSCGHLVCVDLTTGAEAGLTCIPDHSIVGLETITDSALDCTYLLITTNIEGSSSSTCNNQPGVEQFRLLLEQRSTGYNWPSPASSCSLDAATASGSEPSKGLSKSRLSGLKQMSVAGLANLRQRLSEGRKQFLDRRSGTIEMGQEALDSLNSAAKNNAINSFLGSSTSSTPIPEPLAPKIGATRVCVQRSGDDGHILAGIFPETAILTLHNSALEMLPQTAYRLPRGADKLTIIDNSGKVCMVVVSSTTRSDTSARGRRGHIHVVSARHAELHLDSSTKSESVFQSFSLSSQETVLGLVRCRPRPTQKLSSNNGSAEVTDNKSRTEESVKKESQQSQECSSSSTSSPLSSTSHQSASSSSPLDLSSPSKFIALGQNCSKFARSVQARVADARRRRRLTGSGCAASMVVTVLTTRGLYLLEPDREPLSVFFDLAAAAASASPTGSAVDPEAAAERAAELLAIGDNAAGGTVADPKELFELAADVRLCERDFGTAIGLYRLAGCRHLQVALKLAASGSVPELLSYLTTVLLRSQHQHQVMTTSGSQNLDVSPADRIHLSNLALMAYFQQILTKTTPSARLKFQEQVRHFLDENRWFDETLSVRLSSETRQWDLLAHLTTTRGLAYEATKAVLIALQGKENQSTVNSSVVQQRLREMSGTERGGLLACLLRRHCAEVLLASPPLLSRLTATLTATLPLLEEAGLKGVLAQVAPHNAGLRRIYRKLIVKGDKGYDDERKCEEFGLALALANLSVEAALLLLKKRRQNGKVSEGSSKYLTFVKKDLRRINRSSRMPRRPLCAGPCHAMLVRPDDESVFSWGSSAGGAMGHGADATRFVVPPRRISHFASAGSKVKVYAVHAGKAHSLAVTDCGLFSWGSSLHGQLGLGRERRAERRPAMITALSHRVISAAAAGQYHSLALDVCGRVYSWGWGVHGQLGTGDVEDEFKPRRIRLSGCLKGAQVSAGYAHSLVLSTDGEVWAFGCGLFGQMGGGHNRKCSVPTKVASLSGVRLVASGFFHCLAVTGDHELYVWGCNPQVLRLEAQQKKRERLQGLKKHQQQQEHRNNNLLKKSNDLVAASADSSVAAAPDEDRQHHATDEKALTAEDAAETSHLAPMLVDASAVRGRIVQMSCGNQHSVLLTDEGIVIIFGRNVDGQLGTGSRREERVPVQLTGRFLDNSPIVEVAAGADYTLALSSSGTVIAWGSNSFAQLGRAPVDDIGGGVGNATTPTNGLSSGEKVLMMKTTRRIIKLKNSLQNSSDVPRPVQFAATLTENSEDDCDNTFYPEDNTVSNLSDASAEEAVKTAEAFRHFSSADHDGGVEILLHLIMETFHPHLDVRVLVKRCLVADNPTAAAKLSLLGGNMPQAFEFALQQAFKEKRRNEEPDASTKLAESIFKAFVFYSGEAKCRDEDYEDEEEGQMTTARKRLLERLVSCWQDQRFSFVHLERLFLMHADSHILRTLVLTLFRPEYEENEERCRGGPDEGGPEGPKMVNLFTPEFCLKIGDRCVKDIKVKNAGKEMMKGQKSPELEEAPSSLVERAGQWLVRTGSRDNLV